MIEVIIRGEDQRRMAIRAISALDLTKPWKITLQKYVKKRSLNQNNLLHSWFEIIANELGDDPESVKSDFKRMFSPKVERVSKINGEETFEPMGTHEMNTIQMSEFMTKVSAFAGTTLGIFLPHPEDAHKR